MSETDIIVKKFRQRTLEWEVSGVGKTLEVKGWRPFLN